MAATARLLSLENNLISIYAFYTCLLVVKMVIVSLLTSYYRSTRKVFHFANDYRLVVPDKEKRTVTKIENVELVERVRRAHRNDLENIPIFLLVGLLYILTNPSVNAALMVFRLFTAVRIIHTIAYLNSMSLMRSIAFVVGFFLIAYVSITVLMECTVS